MFGVIATLYFRTTLLKTHLVDIVVPISGVYLWIVRRKFYIDYFLKLSHEQNTN